MNSEITLKQAGICRMKDGRELPIYECGDFINTLEGWTLLAQCAASKNFQPYREAKAAYEEARGCTDH